MKDEKGLDLTYWGGKPESKKMTAEEYIEEAKFGNDSIPHKVVHELDAKKALEIKEREFQEKLKELRESLFEIYRNEVKHDEKWALGVKYSIAILDKHLDDKK